MPISRFAQICACGTLTATGGLGGYAAHSVVHRPRPAHHIHHVDHHVAAVPVVCSPFQSVSGSGAPVSPPQTLAPDSLAGRSPAITSGDRAFYAPALAYNIVPPIGGGVGPGGGELFAGSGPSGNTALPTSGPKHGPAPTPNPAPSPTPPPASQPLPAPAPVPIGSFPTPTPTPVYFPLPVISPVPEPGSIALLALGSIVVWVRQRRSVLNHR